MINYEKKDKGMTYTYNGEDYVINHTIVRLVDYKEEDPKVKLHIMFKDGRESICEPYYDPSVDLEKDMLLKIAYIDLGTGRMESIRIHGYEKPSEDETKEFLESSMIIQEPRLSLNKEGVNVEELYSRFQGCIKSVKNKHLNNVLNHIFNKYQEDFKIYPAGTSVHHSYRGGLLQHSLSVAQLAYLISSRFNGIDTDLVITAALIHDIGKLFEYEKDGSRSTCGYFRDHISIGAEIISKVCDEEGVPEDLKNQLVHIILSHHGKEEWGSTKKPSFPEAFIVFSADYIDSHIFMYNNDLINLSYGENVFNKYLGTYVYQKNLESYTNYLK